MSMTKLVQFSSVFTITASGVALSYVGNYAASLAMLFNAALIVANIKTTQLLDETIILAKSAIDGWGQALKAAKEPKQ